MIIAVRALLAVVLLIGVYLLLSVLLVFYLLLIALTVWSASTGSFQPNFLLALVGGGFMALALVRALARGPARDEERHGTVEVHRADAPGLWRLVDELAEQVGTRAPTELRLTAEVNAAVSEDARALGLLPGSRCMYIGAPLLVGLTTDELRAVLCHELGHFARGHTRLGLVAYRGSLALTHARRNIALAAMANNLARMYAGIPFHLLSGYAWVYHRISFAVLRRQELAADAEAARITGRQVTAEALRSRETLAAAWAHFHTGFVEPLRQRGSIPDNVISAFQVMINDPDYRDVLAEHRGQTLTGPPTTSRDTHPSLQDRLAALSRLPDTPVASDPTDPLGLLREPDKVFRRLTRRLGVVPWREWLAGIAERQAATQLDTLRTAVAKVVGARDLVLTPAVVLDLLESGHAARLDAALGAPPDTADRAPLRAAVLILIGQALVAAGAASWTGPWTGAPRLIPRDCSPERIQELVHAAVHKPTEVSRLRLELASSHVDIERPATRPDEDGKAATSESDDEPDLSDQRSSVALVLGAAAVVVVIAVLGSLGGNDERPTYHPPAVRPLPNTLAPLPLPTFDILVPTISIPRPTYHLPLPSLVPIR